jgi:hypothetical protein
MFALPNGNFLQIENTATHTLSLDLLFCVQLADTFSALQLAFLPIFRQKPEFQGVQDTNIGGNETHSHLFNPSLKPTHSVISY